jgi:hypothetical protein
MSRIERHCQQVVQTRMDTLLSLFTRTDRTLANLAGQ